MVRPGPEGEGRALTRVAIKRALISVYDKTGLTGLAQVLNGAGIEIVSTGSTAVAIGAAGVPVTRVEDLTGFPECLDGRVKTLHPGVHAGLLADLRQPAHRDQLRELGVAPFELLVSNLYPFEQTAARGAPIQECVEQIDIGGPAMVRAAAKNHANVAVITDPSMYGAVTDAVAGGGFTLAQRRRLAARAYAHTASYDAAVASWFASVYAPDDTAAETGWPDVVGRALVPAGSAAIRGEPAPAGSPVCGDGPAAWHRRGAAGARQGDVVQQLRGRGSGLAGGVRLHRAMRCDHQAFQPMRDRDRRRPGTGPPQGARLRPCVGVRRGDRRQRCRDSCARRPDLRDLHGGRPRAGLRARSIRAAHGEEESAAADLPTAGRSGTPPPPGPWSGHRRRPRPPSGASWTAACSCSPRTCSTRPETTRPAGS